MLRHSYSDILDIITRDNEDSTIGSRYTIVIAAAKRARQLINGSDSLCTKVPCNKPLSIAVEEVYEGKVKIIGDEEQDA